MRLFAVAGVVLFAVCSYSGQQQEFEELGNRALAAVRAGRFEDAVPAYRRMLDLDATNAGVRFDYALALNRLGRARESLKVLGTPKAPDALALAGANYRILGQPRSAATVLRRAFSAAPSPAIAYDLGLTLLDLEMNTEAERVFRRFPEDPHCLTGLGLVAYATGRNEDAARALTKAVSMEPNAGDLHASLGDVHFAMAAFEEAAREYETAIRLDSRNSEYRVKAARNLSRLNRDQDAAENLRAALKLDPMQPDANFELAKMSPPSDRLKLLQRAIAADPGKSNGFYQLMLACKTAQDAACSDFARRNYEHLQASGGPVKVDMHPPSVILEGPPEERRWGRYQFPTMHRMADGRLIVFVHVEADSATAYGSPKKVFVSADDGLTWREDSAAQNEAYGFRIAEGEWLRVDTPPSLMAKDLNLPERVGAFTMYRTEYSVYPLRQLPRDLRLIFFQRFVHGKWQQESSEVDDADGLRYTVQERFPRIWWGDFHRAADGSLLAVTYPRIAPTEPYRFGSACYRSVDGGRTWKMRGQITYEPDSQADPKAGIRGGFTEPAFTVLKDGSLYSVLRTTDGNGVGPMYDSRSADMGRTWSKPRAFTPNGVLPRLLKLDNGVLVLSSGRPGVQLRFSAKGDGSDWSEPWDLLPITSGASVETDTCAYTDMVPLDRDSFLLVYSWFFKPDSEGKVRKAILARRIRVTSSSSGKTK